MVICCWSSLLRRLKCAPTSKTCLIPFRRDAVFSSITATLDGRISSKGTWKYTHTIQKAGRGHWKWLLILECDKQQCCCFIQHSFFLISGGIRENLVFLYPPRSGISYFKIFFFPLKKNYAKPIDPSDVQYPIKIFSTFVLCYRWVNWVRWPWVVFFSENAYECQYPVNFPQVEDCVVVQPDQAPGFLVERWRIDLSCKPLSEVKIIGIWVCCVGAFWRNTRCSLKNVVQWKLDLADTNLAENLDFKDTP